MFYMTKSPRKNVPDVGIELEAACMPSRHTSDRTTAPVCMGMGQQRNLNIYVISDLVLSDAEYYQTKGH